MAKTNDGKKIVPVNPHVRTTPNGDTIPVRRHRRSTPNK